MTDIHDDELNAAIDGVLAGGPVCGADDDTLALARLASHLRGMPSPDFKSRLAADLFPERRRPFLGRIPVLNNITSRRLAAPLGVAAIAAIAIAVLIFSPLGGSGGRTAEAFGTLPVPVEAPGSANQDATGHITWELAPNITLPDSAPAYRLSMPAVTAERTEQIAHAIGVTGSAEPINDAAGAIGYGVGAAPDCKPVDPASHCPPSLTFWTNGWFSYESGIRETGAAPGDAAALAAATDWISHSGITNGDSYELTIQPPPVLPDKPEGVPGENIAYAAQVIAQPAGHTGPENGPIIFFTVDGNGTVTDAGGFWAKIADESDYHLHNSDALLASLNSQRPTFATLETEAGDFSAADITRDAVAQIANVQLTYRQATPGGQASPDQAYLVPVYTVKTILTQDGQEIAGFATWVAATGPTG